MREKYYIERGNYGNRLVLVSAWEPAYLDDLSNHDIAEIELNYAKGWMRTELEFLLLFPKIQALKITDWEIENVSTVANLKFLRELELSVFCEIDFDFSIFPLLESCALEWNKGMHSIFKCKQLRRIFINKFPEPDFTKFRGFDQLEWLSLKSPKLHTFDGTSELTNLQFLGIYLATKLKSLAGLEALPRLTRLEVDTCRKVSDIDPLASLKRLQIFHLSNMNDIASLAPLRNQTRLAEVLLLESTNILDGDMYVLEGLPALKKLFFMYRKHYSHRPMDFPQYLYWRPS